MAVTPQVFVIVFTSVAFVMLGIHGAVFFVNNNVFNVLMSMYVLGFIVTVLVLTYKKKECTAQKERDTILYISLFLIMMELLILGVSLYRTLAARPSYSY